MVKIDFKRLEVFTDIDKTMCTVVDVRKQFANIIYSQASGIEAHALALKIYQSDGEIEFGDDERDLITHCAERFCSPMFIDAIRTALGKEVADVDS